MFIVLYVERETAMRPFRYVRDQGLSTLAAFERFGGLLTGGQGPIGSAHPAWQGQSSDT